jgi:hypothetical protein
MECNKDVCMYVKEEKEAVLGVSAVFLLNSLL